MAQWATGCGTRIVSTEVIVLAKSPQPGCARAATCGHLRRPWVRRSPRPPPSARQGSVSTRPRAGAYFDRSGPRADIVRDRSAAGILDVAAASGTRLIVVGSWGERPLVGAIVESVPYSLVHMSTIPVLMVPPGPDDSGRDSPPRITPGR